MELIDLTKESPGGVFALMYGGSGTGKTHFAGTCAELGNTLVIDIDQGYRTLQYAADLKKFSDRLTVVSFQSFGDLDGAYQLVKANSVDKWNKLFKRDVVKAPFDWVVWDTWSEIQWYMHEQLRAEKSLTGVGLKFRKNLEIQHWGALTDLNKLSIQALRECSVNQLILMQETTSKDEVTGAIHGGPGIHGKLVQEMPAYFDVVIRTGVDISGRFTATTKPKGLWTAKTRLAEGKEVTNPTARDFFK